MTTCSQTTRLALDAKLKEVTAQVEKLAVDKRKAELAFEDIQRRLGSTDTKTAEVEAEAVASKRKVWSDLLGFMTEGV